MHNQSIRRLYIWAILIKQLVTAQQDVFVYERNPRAISNVQTTYPAYSNPRKYRLRPQSEWKAVSPVS